VVVVPVRAGKRVIGDGYTLLLYVCVVKCRIFFHYQCHDIVQQLCCHAIKCNAITMLSMSESQIIRKCIHKENYHSYLFPRGPCLLLNTSPFAWPFSIVVFVGDEQSLALVLIENRFASLK